MNKTISRVYRFKVVSYASSPDEFSGLLSQAYHWVYILHDKDEGKDPHYHILLTFQDKKSFAWVRNQVISDQNTFAQAMDDITGDFDYLTHENDATKYQYPESDLVSNDLAFWIRIAGNSEETKRTDTFVEDLLDGKLTYREMAMKYGRDYIRNFRSYDYFVTCVRYQEGLVDGGNINHEP